MKDWSDFLKSDRSLLIAPAGHGKTTAIAECLLQCGDNSCHLILTHTHAGIASLMSKFRDFRIPSHKYKLETITGFAQRIVLSQLGEVSLPACDNKDYFDRAVELCTEIILTKRFRYILSITYSGIFVDEYQDCTLAQHKLIMALSHSIPFHCLGDEMQAIFSFEKKPLVNFRRDLSHLEIFQELSYPWRWHPDNLPLGREILRMRNQMEQTNSVSLFDSPDSQVYVKRYPEGNSFSNEYRSFLWSIVKLCNGKSVLWLCPSYYETNSYGVPILRGDLTDRLNLKSIIDPANQYIALDAIDSSKYYSVATKLDEYIQKCATGRRIKKIAHLYDLLLTMYFQKTGLNKWIDRSKNELKSRQKDNKSFSEILNRKFSNFCEAPSVKNLFDCIKYITSLPEVKCNHRAFLKEVQKALLIACEDNLSIASAMSRIKTIIRHTGRKIDGKCIGSTLLTKGLEFDTVVVCDAEKFEDKRHFYVAISRACKRLIILTRSEHINFLQ